MAEDTRTSFGDSRSMANSTSLPQQNTITAAGPLKRPTHGSIAMVAFRVIKASLSRNFERFGKMDPYVIVKITDNARISKEISRTYTHWDGHTTPVWDHTCRAQPIDGMETIEFTIYEDDMVGKDTRCGTATVALRELVDVAGVHDLPVLDEFQGPVCKLPLSLKGENTGTIDVQAVLFRMSSSTTMTDESFKRLEVDMFESPIEPLSVSGGTAAFYKLRLRNPLKNQTRDHYIGKDLSHALDEVQFYEEMRTLRDEAGSSGLGKILSFAFDYAGIAACELDGGKKVEVLVLKNLRDGYKRLRLLDIKLGSKTAAGGWKGKSRMAAFRQGLLDGVTNSCAEGFRLEGFDSMPNALLSMDPLLDVGGSGDTKMAKKARRLAHQMMKGPEMVMHFLDVHDEPGLRDVLSDTVVSPTELSEIVLHEIVQRMVRLCLVCHQSPVPQKWIGSSVALGFEVGELPARSAPVDSIRKKVQCHIFDWGRSELNTLEKHFALTTAKQHDRSKFWAYYVGGLTRLTWDLVRSYYNRFCVSNWVKFHLALIDFDSLMPVDFIGRLSLLPEEAAETTVTFDIPTHESLITPGKHTFTYAVSWRSFPAGSRLRGAWRIHIKSASNLPRYDKMLLKSKSDPYVEVTAISMLGHNFRQRTSIIPNTLDPEWNEVLEFPEVAIPDMLESTLNSLGEGLGELPLEDVLPPEHVLKNAGTCHPFLGLSKGVTRPFKHGSALEHSFLEWESRIKNAASASTATDSKDRSLRLSVEHESIDLAATLTEIRKQEEAAQVENGEEAPESEEPGTKTTELAKVLADLSPGNQGLHPNDSHAELEHVQDKTHSCGPYNPKSGKKCESCYCQ